MNTLDTIKYKAKQIKLLILDVDGVLTDGSIIYSSDSKELKAFHSHDGQGIKLLQLGKISVAIITGRTSKPVKMRSKELGIKYVIQGSQNKLQDLKKLVSTHFENLEFENIAYIGDDIQDLLPMQQVGLSFAPQNAHKTIKAMADYTTELGGGFGAVREVCDILLEANS